MHKKMLVTSKHSSASSNKYKNTYAPYYYFLPPPKLSNRLRQDAVLDAAHAGREFYPWWVSSPLCSISSIINLKKIKQVSKSARLSYRLRFWPWLRLSLLLAVRSCSSGRCGETGLFCKALSQQNGALRRRREDRQLEIINTRSRAPGTLGARFNMVRQLVHKRPMFSRLTWTRMNLFVKHSQVHL